MILTGKAVEFAEQFEAINDTLQKHSKLNSTPLNEDEQSTIYIIQRMFELDTTFRSALTGFFALYAGASMRDQLPKLLTSLIELTYDLLPKESSNG